jgi:hypothetical protein
MRSSLSAASDSSRAAEADRHLIAVNNHRHDAAPLAEPEHPLELRRVLLDVDELERNMPPLKVVTGGLRIRSSLFAEDVDHGPLSHQRRPRVRPGSDLAVAVLLMPLAVQFETIAIMARRESKKSKDFASP